MKKQNKEGYNLIFSFKKLVIGIKHANKLNLGHETFLVSTCLGHCTRLNEFLYWVSWAVSETPAQPHHMFETQARETNNVLLFDVYQKSRSVSGQKLLGLEEFQWTLQNSKMISRPLVKLFFFSSFFHFYQLKITNLDDNVSLPGPAAVKLAVLLYHHNLPLLLHLVRVLLNMVKDAPVVLLGDADKLVEDDMGKADELVVQQNTALHDSWVLKQQHRRSMKAGWERHGRHGQIKEWKSNNPISNYSQFKAQQKKVWWSKSSLNWPFLVRNSCLTNSPLYHTEEKVEDMTCHYPAALLLFSLPFKFVISAFSSISPSSVSSSVYKDRK